MISKRAQSIDSSGIRRVFDLAAKLSDPINLSIGQPVFGPSPAVKAEAIKAIEEGKSGYTVTQGIAPLRAKIKERYAGCNADELEVFVTAGVSGGLMLAYMALLDPGDEVLIPDPFFCIYRDLALLINAVPVCYDLYPDFRLSAERIEALITPRTKVLLVNSPANPTGYACSQAELDEIVELARRHGLTVIYDEIYDSFTYDQPHAQCLGRYDKLILLNGFSKGAGVPGWRVGYVAAPPELAAQMLKIQQYTLVCANSIAQWALVEALQEDFTGRLHEYRAKRDFIVTQLRNKYRFSVPGGAFYLFPEAPGGSGQQFIERCIERNLLAVPGNVFSRRDTHFRLSFSASQRDLERGVEVLLSLA